MSELLSIEATCSAFDFCCLDFFVLGLDIILFELNPSCWLFPYIKLALSLTSGAAFMGESAAFDNFFDAVMVGLFAFFFATFFFLISGKVSCSGTSSAYVFFRLLYQKELTSLGE